MHVKTRPSKQILLILSFLILITSCSKNTLKDYDGNRYKTVMIGDQIWMAENLKVTHYRDGTPIQRVKSESSEPGVWKNLTTGHYCIYSDEEYHDLQSNQETYGNLYNWYAVNGDTDGDGEKDKELAPEGWHVPTNEEWYELIAYLSNNGYPDTDDDFGTEGTGGVALKASIGWNESGNGKDAYDFNALPGGERWNSGRYERMGDQAYFWTATDDQDKFDTQATAVWLEANEPGVFVYFAKKKAGLSVRLLRD
jgi:uncharacterized protein (TIGR02145 family)